VARGGSEAKESKLRELFSRATAEAAGSGRYREFVAELHRVYRPAVEKYVAKNAPTACVEDICNETWAAVPQALERFRGESSFWSWLVTIATYKTRDELRRRKKVKPNAISSVISKLLLEASSTERPSRKVARAEKDERVREVLQQLSPDEQKLVRLCYYESLTVVEIARELKLSTDAVKQRLHRVREHIESMLPSSVG
jgi:RNA polymerase sigma-70 factor, ECF subfamily